MAGTIQDQVIEVQGARVPSLGFGTYLLFGMAASEAVEDALAIGYRHIDTARGYENERYVGIGLKNSEVPRSEIFLTSKARIRTSEALKSDHLTYAVVDSLERLATDYLDLFLLHWPATDLPLHEVLAAVVRVRDQGLARHIGVSNFPSPMLAAALDLAPIFCHQVEYHPFLSQDRLLAIAQERDVLVTAHSPLAGGRVAHDATLTRIGLRHGKTAIQVALRWLIDQRGVGAIPTGTYHAWRLHNCDVFDFVLSPSERAEIDALPKGFRVIDPPDAPSWDD